MVEEIEQLEVKAIPKECPVCEPCPVCPSKPKFWQVCLKLFFLLIAAMSLAFVLLASSGLRIVRKESLLDIWLAGKRGITPSPEITEPTPTPDPTADWKTYQNTALVYSYKYPLEWGSATSKFNENNSLFGPGADIGSGLGGVEAKCGKFNSAEDYVAYNEKNTEIKYENKREVTIDGKQGIRLEYKGFPVSGVGAVVKNNNCVLNIFLNSTQSSDTKIFDQILSTFKFLD